MYETKGYGDWTMRREGEQIIIEIVTDGRIAADAAAIASGDGLADMYRNIDESRLPVRMGKWASEDVVAGLKHIVRLNMNVNGYLDPNVATTYLGFLGVSVDSRR